MCWLLGEALLSIVNFHLAAFPYLERENYDRVFSKENGGGSVNRWQNQGGENTTPVETLLERGPKRWGTRVKVLLDKIQISS